MKQVEQPDINQAAPPEDKPQPQQNRDMNDADMEYQFDENEAEQIQCKLATDQIEQ